MPNWCENKLTVTSENQEQLQEFIEKVRDPDKNTELSFNKLLPCPIELLNKEVKDYDFFPDELKRKYGYEDCYTWRLENWGTQLDVEETTKKVFDCEVLYSFKTLGPTSVHWLVKMACMFPDLKFQFKYENPSTGFITELNASC